MLLREVPYSTPEIFWWSDLHIERLALGGTRLAAGPNSDTWQTHSGDHHHHYNHLALCCHPGGGPKWFRGVFTQLEQVHVDSCGAIIDLLEKVFINRQTNRQTIHFMKVPQTIRAVVHPHLRPKETSPKIGPSRCARNTL